jgi:hypothetical protein
VGEIIDIGALRRCLPDVKYFVGVVIPEFGRCRDQDVTWPV